MPVKPADRPRTVENIQILRFLAALVVVLFHARLGVLDAAGRFLPEWLRHLQTMGFSGVDVFFVISGTIMALVTRATVPSGRSVLQFGALRVGRIYSGWWPFFVLSLVAVALTGQLQDKHLLASFWLWQTDPQGYLIPVIWTLSYELYFYGLVALLLFLPRRARTAGMGLIALAVVTCTAVSWAMGLFSPAGAADNTVLQRFLLSPLVLEFAAGYLLCSLFLRHELLGKAGPRERTAWLAAALLLAGTATWYQFHVAAYPNGLAGYYHQPERIVLLGGMALCLVAWALRGPGPQRWAGRMLVRGGNASYAVYLGQSVCLLVAYKVFYAFLAPSSAGIVLAGYAFAATVVCAYAALHYRFIERPLHRLVRRSIKRWLPRPEARPEASGGARVGSKSS